MKISCVNIISIIFFCELITNTLGGKLLTVLNSPERDEVPRVSLCNGFKDLFDNGVYLKTACFVHQPLTYDVAKHKCAEYNMNLFIIDNEIVTSHLQDAEQE